MFGHMTESLPLATALLIGVSGSGKTTILNKIIDRDERFYQPVSCTTRSPREGEVHGREYFYITDEEFAQRVASGEFAEHATFNGKSYGTLWSEIQKPGKIIVRVTENDGAKNLKRDVAAKIVAVLPPDEQTWIERFVARGDDEAEVRARIEIDKQRIAEIMAICDISIVNDDADRAAQQLYDYLQQLAA